MVNKRGLGRGLDSLIPTDYVDEDGGVREIPLSAIELNPRQPRQQMDSEELEGLADSIKSCGIIQPVVVRPGRSPTGAEDGHLYELAVGERRLRAARMAGLQTVPAIVRDLSDEQMLETALVENIQRQDLNPIEKARAIRQLILETALTQEQAGQRLGMSRPAIANLLRLLELPEQVQQMVSRGTLSAGHARALLAIEQDDQRVSLAKKIASGGLSVRQAEALVRPKPVTLRPENSPHIREMESALQKALGTRVRIRRRGLKGRIIIHFAGHDAFERIFELITHQAAKETPQKASA